MIIQRFNTGVQGYKIIRIERVYNPDSERSYDAMREEINRHEKPSDEIMMFHGTASHNVQNYIFLPPLSPQ